MHHRQHIYYIQYVNRHKVYMHHRQHIYYIQYVNRHKVYMIK